MSQAPAPPPSAVTGGREQATVAELQRAEDNLAQLNQDLDALKQQPPTLGHIAALTVATITILSVDGHTAPVSQLNTAEIVADGAVESALVIK